MSFIETVQRAEELLRQRGRISLRALKREFDLDDATLDDFVEELVEAQQVAALEGKVLSWIGPSADAEAGPAEGAPSSQAEFPPEAERRQLTVLFCDLVDSTRLASGMDPEDWRGLVRGYQRASAEVVERFDGHVAQYLGDGLLVYFGWPRAHEDDAERAVRAGLGILEAVRGLREEERPELLVRIGIHTGPVVVGEMGGGASRETLAMGDTTNVAARLQTMAKADTVVMSSATLRLVSGIFVTRDLEEQSLKGLAEPVRIFQAVQASGVRSRLDVTAATELTPFIGREQELMLLEDRFAQVSEGSGQAVLVCGEAGIGKSRLVQAFRERLAERAHSWLECRGSPYTQDSALLPVIELQRRGLGFRPEDPQDTKLVAIEAGLAGVDFNLAQTVPLMAALHGGALGDRYPALDLSPEGIRKKTLALLVEWLLRLGQRQPLVLLMEDLHWMDPSTVELLGQILEQIPTASVLLLVTYRPDFEPPWGARSHLTPMLLSRFTRAQLGDLVRKAARGRDLPDAWVEEILRRADGVPLFAEELTRTVLESHPEVPKEGSIPALQIPDTLQDSLMACLDALGPVKELAQLGSVLGREFDYELLLAVSPMKEAELQKAVVAAVREELFYQRGVPPEASYLFKHALIRDAAYESMLRATRQRHHARVAETLIERTRGLAAAQPERVAHHLSEAGDVERAIDWWQRAGEQANARVAHEEAIRHLRRGLALLYELPTDPSRGERELPLQLGLGASLSATRGFEYPATMESWERAASLCDPAVDPVRSGAIRYGLSSGFLGLGEPERSLDRARELLQIGEASGEELLVVGGHRACGSALVSMGKLAPSREHLESAMLLYDPDRHRFFEAGFSDDLGVSAFGWGSWALWHLGFPDQAWSAARRGVELARHPYSVAYANVLAGNVAVQRGDFEQAKAWSREAVRICAEQGLRQFETFNRVMGIWAEALAGDHPGAVARFAAAAATGTGSTSRAALGLILGAMAQLNLLESEAEQVEAVANGALAMSRRSNIRYYEPEYLRLKAEALLLDERDLTQAEACLREALDIACSQEAKSFELRAATSLARLWRDQGKRTEARDLSSPSTTGSRKASTRRT